MTYRARLLVILFPLLLCTTSGCVSPFGDPSKHIRLRGGFSGAYGTAGGELHNCDDRCNPPATDGSISIYTGMLHRTQGAFVVDGTVIWTDSTRATAGLNQLALTFGYQYWMHPRLFVRATTGPFAFAAHDEVSDWSARGLGGAITGSIGTNWIEGAGMAMDLRLFVMGAGSTGGLHGFAGLGIGVAIY